MTGTNIYKNYTATLSDLYRQEVNVAADIGEITLSTSQKEESGFLRAFLVALVGFAAAAGLILLIMNPFKKGEDFPEYIPDTASKPIVAPNTQYVQIQLIEFEDAQELEILPSLYDRNDESGKILEGGSSVPAAFPKSESAVQPAEQPKPVQTKPIVPPKPVVQTKPAVQPKPAVQSKVNTDAVIPRIYSLRVDGISLSDYNRIKEISGSVNITADRSAEHRNMWALYVPASGTGMFIEGSEVLPVSYFDSKEAAVRAAEEKAERGELSILKQEAVRFDLYNVTLCCLEIDDAKQLAQNSGITDKVFQLRRR